MCSADSIAVLQGDSKQLKIQSVFAAFYGSPCKNAAEDGACASRLNACISDFLWETFYGSAHEKLCLNCRQSFYSQVRGANFLIDLECV